MERASSSKRATLRSEHGFLIIADEIQSGAGRTGRFYLQRLEAATYRILLHDPEARHENMELPQTHAVGALPVLVGEQRDRL